MCWSKLCGKLRWSTMHEGGSWRKARLDAAHLNLFVLPCFCCRREDIRSVKVTAGSLMSLLSVSNDRVWFYLMLSNLFSVSLYSTSLYFTAIIAFSMSHLTVDYIYLSDGRKCSAATASPQPPVWPFPCFHIICAFKCFDPVQVLSLWRQEPAVTGGPPWLRLLLSPASVRK